MTFGQPKLQEICNEGSFGNSAPGKTRYLVNKLL